ncbi:MAG: GGDEF domain-containing protein [Candidatus Micrarchaeia archaeon]
MKEKQKKLANIEIDSSMLKRIKALCINYGFESCNLKDMLEYVLEIAEKSNIDLMTGLYNKQQFEKDLSRQIIYAERTQSSFSVAVLDFNDLRNVNNTLGHKYGDVAIEEAAKAITKNIREYDTAYRIGGDEFAIILPQATQEHIAGIVYRIKRDVKESVEKTFAEQGLMHKSRGISIGFSSYSGELRIIYCEEELKRKAAELFEEADKAMYADKNKAYGEGMLRYE